MRIAGFPSRRPRRIPLALAGLLALVVAAPPEPARAGASDAVLAPLDARPGLAAMLARAETRLTPHFAANGIYYPPSAAAFVALKEEGRLELWAEADDGWRFVRSYLIRAASGRLGPKLREGDRQVPEGVYRISALNPNSRYHLSMRLDYPNEFDRARAADEGRTHLGGDIMIHGNRVSVGCIAVGDEPVEELFALAARLGPEGVRVVVSPRDLRRIDPSAVAAEAGEAPPWLATLYGSIAHALADFPLPAGAAAPDAAAPAPAKRAAVAKPRCREGDANDCVRRCAKGDAASCARAGLLYGDGSRGDADADKAWTFLRQACTAGDASGCAELGRLHVADNGLRRDVALAAALAGAACDAGEGRGCAVLGRICRERLVYPAAWAECTAERTERAAGIEQAACGGACDGSIFDAGRPFTTSP